MLPKNHRATRQELTQADLRLRIRTAHLLFTFSRTAEGPARLTCSISKKVAKLAVTRNLLERRCRHALRDALPSFPAGIVGVVRILNKDTAFADFENEVQEIIARLVK